MLWKEEQGLLLIVLLASRQENVPLEARDQEYNQTTPGSITECVIFLIAPGAEPANGYYVVYTGVVWRSLQAKIPECIRKSNPKKKCNKIYYWSINSFLMDYFY